MEQLLIISIEKKNGLDPNSDAVKDSQLVFWFLS